MPGTNDIPQKKTICQPTYSKTRMIMSRVSINTPAPDFTLPDFEGGSFRLYDFREKYNVLLVFNRTFI
jgi:hypothetical protein